MKYYCGIDTGGTFTDCLVSDDQTRRETKILSSGMVRARCCSLGFMRARPGEDAALTPQFAPELRSRHLDQVLDMDR